MSAKKQDNKTFGIEKWVCLFGYLLVPLFFVLLYLLMTQSFEDIWQGTYTDRAGFDGAFSFVFHKIGRLGDYLAYSAGTLMTPQVSMGIDIVLRLLTAALASGSIYLGTMLVLGRRPKLQYKDVAIYLGIMFLMMASPFSKIYMHRFNFVFNYVSAITLALGVAVLFRTHAKSNIWGYFGSILLGFLLGISSEIIPIAAMILIIACFLIKLCKKEISWQKLWQEYKLQLFVVLGIIIGMLFFYFGGSIGSKIGSDYAEKYDYISLLEIFVAPIGTVSRWIQHIWFNLRYINIAFLLMMIFILVESTLLMKKKEKNKFLYWQIILFCFVIMYFVATSLLKVHDDMYGRLMSPMYMAIVLSVGMFVYHILEVTKLPRYTFRVVMPVLLILNILLIVDMVYAFSNYKQQVADRVTPDLSQLAHDEKGNVGVMTELGKNELMKASPIFRFKQFSPFGWGPDDIYIKYDYHVR